MYIDLVGRVAFSDLQKPDDKGNYSIKILVEDKDAVMAALSKELTSLPNFANEKLAQAWAQQQLQAKPNRIAVTDGNLELVPDGEDVKVRDGYCDVLVVKLRTKFVKENYSKIGRGQLVKVKANLSAYSSPATKAFGALFFLNEVEILEEACPKAETEVKKDDGDVPF